MNLGKVALKPSDGIRKDKGYGGRTATNSNRSTFDAFKAKDFCFQSIVSVDENACFTVDENTDFS